MKESCPTSSASECCSTSSIFSMISAHIYSGTTERTASLIWPNWTFITSDFAAVVPGIDQRLQPTRRDDAGVHINLGVRVDKGLITS